MTAGNSMWRPLIRQGSLMALVLMGAPILPAGATQPFTCDIAQQARGPGLMLTGIVRATQPLRGNYSLVVTSQGAGGSSNVTQGGSFTAPANVATQLGSVMVNSGAGSRFSASLHIQSEDGQTCDAER